MSLLPPVVVGPLSVCSSSVRVQGQLIGATVDLFQDGANVGGGAATWGDQVFSLKSGVTLKAGVAHPVTATQAFGGVTSPASAPVVVQTKAAIILPVSCETHIYECGQCLSFDGMVPGAIVVVTVGAVVRGTGTAADGSAQIGLSSQTSLGETLVAQQIACGTPGPKTNLAPPDPLPGGKRQLPPPAVNGPLQACMVAVNVGNVTDGAQVIMTETPAPGFTEQACFSFPGAWFQCPPLTQGSSVSAIQTMPKCDIRSASSPPVLVGPPTPVPPPTVVPPLCAGSVRVRLTGLLPGSPVEIFQDSTSLGKGSAPASTFDFGVPPLAGNSEITATQELCGNVSLHSNQVKVDPAPRTLPTPVVAGPLFQCGAAVHVSHLHPGAIVYVWSTILGAPIGSQAVYGTQADVPVAPLLLTGDNIFATQNGCGRVSSKSAPVTVLPLKQPAPPIVLPTVEACMRSVTVGGAVVPGAHVDVYVNNVWRGTAIATAGVVEVPLSGSLNVGDQVKARQSICGIITDFGPPVVVISSAGFYYLTQHYTTARTGWFPYETTLNVGNVPKLKYLFTQNLDGTVYAQPLYAHHVNIPGSGAHNAVYVATENDTVYAFDADTQQPALWQRSLIPAGEQAFPDSVAKGGNIKPVIGITSTPVIDCASYTMWVVAKTMSVLDGTVYNRLYAIDISTGADRPGSPVEIQGSYPSSTYFVSFSTNLQMNRPALLLLGGRIYIGFGSHSDALKGWRGWVFAYDATTLKRVGVFCTAPDEAEGSVWQGGMGLAADPEGFVYFMTGNGPWDGKTNYGDTALKLPANLTVVADFFTPPNRDDLERHDCDFGSGGPLILPDPPLLSGLPLAMVVCGKDGQIYLIDRRNMKAPLEVVPLPGSPPIFKNYGKKGYVWDYGDGPGVWGGPAYFESSSGQKFIYYCGNGESGGGGNLMAFIFSGNSLSQSYIGSKPNQSAMRFPSPVVSGLQSGGTTPVVSSNQHNTGTGVVWAIVRSNPLQLVAFDATDLTKGPLFGPVAAGPWNDYGGAFIEPTVIQGKVYVPSDGQLNVFGL